MKYIAFLDVLGTKYLSQSSATDYSSMITNFKEKLESVATDKSNIIVYFFSDCAYIEANDLKELVSSLCDLRDRLLANEIFFTAAICRGSLDTTPINNPNIKGILFKGASISRVFLSQSALQGIGILIDPDLRNSYNKKWFKNRIIKNWYIELGEKKEKLTSFYDLLLIEKKNFSSRNDFSIYNTYCYFSLQKSIKEGIKSRRVGRYYFSIIINLLSSIDFIEENIACDEPTQYLDFYSLFNEKKINIYKIYEFFLHHKKYNKELCSKIVGIDYILLFLINKLYSDNGGRSAFTQEILKNIIDGNFLDEYLKNMNLIPNSLFEPENWKPFLEDYYAIIERKVNC